MKIIMHFIIILLFLIISTNSFSRIRWLSLEMDPSVYYAHWWLNFNESAFDTKWLKKEILRHTDETDEDIYNLAALLRMYFEFESKKQGKRFADRLLEKFKYGEYSLEEAIMFKQMYLESSSLTSTDSSKQKEAILTIETLELNLFSNDLMTVAKAIEGLQEYGKYKQVPTKLINRIISLYSTSNQHEIQRASYRFLGYYSYINGNNQDFDSDLDRVVTTSGPTSYIDYLTNERELSNYKVWKYHANKIKSTELDHFFEELQYYDKSDFIKKFKFIKNLNVYKEMSEGFKLHVASELMDFHPKHVSKILKKLYKRSHPLIKSALISKYPKFFKYDEKLWKGLLLSLNSEEQKIVRQNLDMYDL